MMRNFFGNWIYLILLIIFIGVSFLLTKDSFIVNSLAIQLGVVLIPTILFILLIKDTSIKEFIRFNKVSYKKIILSIGIIFLSYPIAVYINAIFNIFLYLIFGKVMTVDAIPLVDTEAKYILNIFLICLLPGICEETLFRGLFLRTSQIKGVKESILYTAFLFSIFHLNIFIAPGIFFLGIVMGYLVIYTNSIIPSMIAHFFNNFIAITMQFLTLRYLSNNVNLESNAPVISDQAVFVTQFVMGILGGVIVLICYKILKKAMKLLKGNTSLLTDDIVYQKSSVIVYLPIFISLILYTGISILFMKSI
ncbi:MAG: CPBP family intramembrane metalloprotease [Peptostreptococcaceae bacterium]|jgi:membrane protease YdiL (CAAX protease family)|nr:CPBP family intramembrane metalloprotease [Peptostreptococcaceae bacterium]